LFWNQMDGVMNGIPSSKEVIVAEDLNGHVGRDRSGVERWHGGWTIGRRNNEGEDILEIVKAYDLALVNTSFQEKEVHLITFESRRSTSMTDDIAIKRDHLGRVGNCKVVPGESKASQCRFLIADLTVCRK